MSPSLGRAPRGYPPCHRVPVNTRLLPRALVSEWGSRPGPTCVVVSVPRRSTWRSSPQYDRPCRLTWRHPSDGSPTCRQPWRRWHPVTATQRGACEGQAGRGRRGAATATQRGAFEGQAGLGTAGGCALGALRSSVGRAPLSSLGARGFRRTVGGRITGWLRRAEAGCSPLVVPSLLWSWAGDRCSEADFCRLPRKGVHFQHQCDTDPMDLPCSGL